MPRLGASSVRHCGLRVRNLELPAEMRAACLGPSRNLFVRKGITSVSDLWCEALRQRGLPPCVLTSFLPSHQIWQFRSNMWLVAQPTVLSVSWARRNPAFCIMLVPYGAILLVGYQLRIQDIDLRASEHY